MSTRRRVALVPALLATALLLAGCGTQDDPEPAASTGSVDASASASADADSTAATEEGGSSDAPPFPSDTSPDEQAASADARVTVTDIRTGRHDGFDRVVFELAGEGLPGWQVGYVDDPAQQGSGDPVEVAGNAVLQVLVTGAGYPYDTGAEEFAAGPVPGSGTDVVTEVVFGATFEGVSEAYIGTTAESPFRVYLLEGPTRIVVEVVSAV